MPCTTNVLPIAVSGSSANYRHTHIRDPAEHWSAYPCLHTHTHTAKMYCHNLLTLFTYGVHEGSLSCEGLVCRDVVEELQ